MAKWKKKKSTARSNVAEDGWHIRGRARDCADAAPSQLDNSTFPLLPLYVGQDDMGRSQRSPHMRDTWIADEVRSQRPSNRPRDFDRRERRPQTPPPTRRAEIRGSPRGRDQEDIDSYRPGRSRDNSRDSRRPFSRRPSLSPVRSNRPKPGQIGRPRHFDERIARPRKDSPYRSPKRRRTQSPSPTRSDRYAPAYRRNSHSRERYEPRDRRAIIDRAFSPRRASPDRYTRPDSRAGPPEIDSYKPYPRKRSPTPPPVPRRDKRPRSPHARSRSPARRPQQHPSSQSRDLSPYSARLLKTQQLSHSDYDLQHSSKIPSNAADDDRASMDGQYVARGHYPSHNHINRGRPPRPYRDTRGGHFAGSPPLGTPNSSYHGSPHSSPQYQGGRGGWHNNRGYQGPHGPHQSSPPYRQNSYPGSNGLPSQSQYFQQQQSHFPNNHPPSHQQPPSRGGRGGHRGGHYAQQGPSDRRFSGPDPQNSPGPRGRGHYNNLQWTPSGPKRGGGQNYSGSHPNSHQTSPAHSNHGHRDSIVGQEEDVPFRPPNEYQIDERRDDNSSTTPKALTSAQQQKDKFSFAFKSKPPPTGPAKAPSDLSTKAKGPPPRADDRAPPAAPAGPKAQKVERKDDRVIPTGPHKKHDSPNNKRHLHPQDRSHPNESRRSGRSRSPPTDKLAKDSKQRPKLTPEFAASESIYYRKPGNESVVGAGTYGKVFKAIHIYTKSRVALKKIRMEGERDGFPITAVREIRLLQHLRHKHVVALQEVMVEKNECFMVFEYLSHDLTGLINHPTFKLTDAHKKDLAKQMFEGLDFLHRRGVLHRDIKAANILVSNTGRLKYADFGLARFYTKSRQIDYTNRVITIWYRPPELLLGETQYGPAVDVWSAACVFTEMFTRKAIFPGEGGELSQLEKVYNVLGTPTRTEWPAIVDLPWFELMQPTERKKSVFESMFKDVFTPGALDVVRDMLKYDPTKRPSAEEVLSYAYFTEEEPTPQQAKELENVQGDWHEFESKAHRRENDRREKERRKEEYTKEREKRKAREAGLPDNSADSKRIRGVASMDRDGERPEDAPPAPEPEAAESDGEGSARMSMS